MIELAKEINTSTKQYLLSIASFLLLEGVKNE